ncbi:MAG: hypothetical protein EBT24_10130 [Betaproteobacteria bacterium]|nr:hypothetical protein [Betaproteobacteria bacterium]NBT11327.1 hypothetical protein [Betaproteobacteria bacterium]NBX95883.1 hypothetical protein [Betaproteobacteria bacterium]
MESSHWPLILIEGVLVFGGALAFGWWQLRSVKRDRERLQAERERQRLQDERESRRESAQPLEGPPKDH